MKLQRLSIARYRLPLRRPLYVRGTTVDEKEGALVLLYDDSGRTGIGEAAPLPFVSAESLDEVVSQLREIARTDVPALLPEGRAWVERWCLAAREHRVTPSVRFALETAALNLYAQSASEPVLRFFTSAAIGRVPVRALLADTAGQWEVMVDSCINAGFTRFKVKAGNDPRTDIERIAALRARAGSNASISIDVNGRWELEEALGFVRDAQPLGIDYIEEPCAGLLMSARLARHCSIPVGVDESFDPERIAVEDLPPEIAVVVLKPSWRGGVLGTLALARRARDAGKRVVIGSLYESSIGLSMLACMSAAIDRGEAAGIGTLTWFADDVTAGPCTEPAFWPVDSMPCRAEDLNESCVRVIHP